MDIYQEEILEHYRHPHNAGRLEHATIVQREHNPLCGDDLTFYIQYDEGRVTDVRFEGQGCAISQAAASMLTDEVRGMTKEEIGKLTPKDMLDLLGIELGPTRLKCALLSLQGVSRAVGQLR